MQHRLIRIVLGLMIPCAGLAACKSSEKTSAPPVTAAGSAAPAQASPPAAAPVPPAPPAADTAVKAEYKPDEAWTTLAGMSNYQRMDKFSSGMTITGAVAKVNDPADAEYNLELDAGGGNVIELTFADIAKAKERKLAPGATVTATACVPANPEGNRIKMTLCALK